MAVRALNLTGPDLRLTIAADVAGGSWNLGACLSLGLGLETSVQYKKSEEARNAAEPEQELEVIILCN